MNWKSRSFCVFLPMVLSTAAFATSFAGGPTGPNIGSNCDVSVTASLLGQGLNGTTNGMELGGSLLQASLGFDLTGHGGCAISWTSMRLMSDVAGNYDMSSHLEADTLAAVNLELLGVTSVTVSTYLLTQPGTVAEVSYVLPLLQLLNSIDLDSGPVGVSTSGTDTLVQRVTLQFGTSLIPILAGVNLSLLTSPEFTSSIVADAGAVPEPGTTALAGVGIALVAVSRLRKRSA